MRRLLAQLVADLLLHTGAAIHERLQQRSIARDQTPAERLEASAFFASYILRRALPVVVREDN